MRAGALTRRFAAAGAVALAVALAVAGCSDGSPASVPSASVLDRAFPADTQKQLNSAVTDAMKATDSSGAIVGVWAPWSGTWVAGLGTVSPSDKTPVTPAMTFRAATVTRPMICDVMYTLAAQHRLDPADLVSSYLPGRPMPAGVTLQTLCDSTSGIGSYGAQLAPLVTDTPQRTWDPSELVAYGLGVDRDFDAGTAYVDSDAGYVLLGQVLQKITGQSPATLLAQDVFGPLGMTSSVLPADAPAAPTVGGSSALGGTIVEKDAAGAPQCKAPTDVTRMSASYGSTNAGVVTDIADLGRYVRALASGALVHEKNRFAQPLRVSADTPSWLTAKGGAIQAGSLIGQYGWMPGYLTAAFSDPKTGLTVAVVLNDSTAGPDAVASLAWELASIGSKAPAASGRTAPAAGLPWTAQQYHDAIEAKRVCGP
jgi:D-alanyl-D-alanine carboxypeptidase